MVQEPPLQPTDYLNAGGLVATAGLHVADADVLVVFAVVLQSSVVAAVAVVLCVAAAAAELAVTVSAVEMFATGVVVVHNIAGVVAGPQALPTAFAGEHYFVVDWMLMPLAKQQVLSCPA